MNHMKKLAFVLGAGLMGALLTPTAVADQWDKKTILTVNEAIQLPNIVLAPGKYVMKLAESPSNRHIVQIFNEDQSQIQTTILAIPNYRLEPTGKTQFSFWETPPGQPKALRAWFYPGDNFGQEFAYPKNLSTSIAAYSKTSVPTTSAQSEKEYTSAPVMSINEQGTESALDRNAYREEKTEEKTEVAQNTPAPEPAPAAAPAPEPAPAPAPTSLPKTASPYPLIALVGLFSLAAFLMIRLARTS